MKIVEVTSYVLRLRADDVYLGIAPDGVPRAGYAVRPPWRSLYSDRFETLLVRITADDGTTGWGEALAPVAPEVVGRIVDLLLAPQLVGAPVRGVRPLWCRLRDLMRERGHLVGHQADALAAVDIALWDMYGKATGMPVTELLGGRFRDAVPVYVSGLPEPTHDRRAALAADWASRGARAVKLHLGHGVAADLATYDAVAKAAPELRIAVDAHWTYPFDDACRLARGLDERNALFLEAPLAPEDLEGHRELAARVVTPIAAGEAMRNRYEFDAWVSARALRIAQPDVARTGLTEALAIAELAAARHVPVAPHHSVGLGVSLAAGLHLAAAVESMPYFEYQPTTTTVAQRILRTPLDIDPSEATVPVGPGLGIDVDVAAVEAFAQQNEERLGDRARALPGTIRTTGSASEEPTATMSEEPTATMSEEPTATMSEEPTATMSEEPTATMSEEN